MVFWSVRLNGLRCLFDSVADCNCHFKRSGKLKNQLYYDELLQRVGYTGDIGNKEAPY